MNIVIIILTRNTLILTILKLLLSLIAECNKLMSCILLVVIFGNEEDEVDKAGWQKANKTYNTLQAALWALQFDDLFPLHYGPIRKIYSTPSLSLAHFSVTTFHFECILSCIISVSYKRMFKWLNKVRRLVRGGFKWSELMQQKLK